MKNVIKVSIMLLLCLIIIFPCFATEESISEVVNQEENISKKVTSLEDVLVDDADTKDFAIDSPLLKDVCLDVFSDPEKEIINLLVEATKTCERDVDISKYNITFQRALKIIKAFSDDNEAFNVGTFGMSGGDDQINSISISYIMSKEETEAYWKKINAKVDKFLKEVNRYDNLTELDKIIFASNFIGKYCTYALSTQNGNGHTIAGSLGDGRCVCDGYAKGLAYLLEKVGIESEVIESSAMNHAWNLVKYQGDWYHIDMTTNDSGGYGNYDYAIFMMPDEAFDGTHGIYSHYGWSTEHTADNSQFLDATWKKTSSKPLVYDGEYWCYARKNMKDNVIITKNDIDTGETKTINLKVDEDFYDQVCLATDGEKFYFSTRKNVYSVNFDGTDLKLIYNDLEENEIFKGIDFIDGVIYCSIADANATGIITLTTKTFMVDNEIPDYTTLDVITNLESISFSNKTSLNSIIIPENFPILNVYYTVSVIDTNKNEKSSSDMIGSKNVIQIKNPLGEVVKEFTAVVPGDVTGNGYARMYDAFLILKDSINGKEIDAIDIKIRDFNGDEKVRMYDAFQFLKQAILGK